MKPPFYCGLTLLGVVAKRAIAVPITSLTSGAVLHTTDGAFPEKLFKQSECALKRLLFVSPVFFSSDSEVGKMVQITPENGLTVSVVLAGGKNVSVPHLIDELGWDEILTPHYAELEKALVPQLHHICPFGSPALAFLFYGKTKLHLDH